LLSLLEKLSGVKPESLPPNAHRAIHIPFVNQNSPMDNEAFQHSVCKVIFRRTNSTWYLTKTIRRNTVVYGRQTARIERNDEIAL